MIIILCSTETLNQTFLALFLPPDAWAVSLSGHLVSWVLDPVSLTEHLESWAMRLDFRALHLVFQPLQLVF
jgi:hypothetical protein